MGTVSMGLHYNYHRLFMLLVQHMLLYVYITIRFTTSIYKYFYLQVQVRGESWCDSMVYAFHFITYEKDGFKCFPAIFIQKY